MSHHISTFKHHLTIVGTRDRKETTHCPVVFCHVFVGGSVLLAILTIKGSFRTVIRLVSLEAATLKRAFAKRAIYL